MHVYNLYSKKEKKLSGVVFEPTKLNFRVHGEIGHRAKRRIVKDYRSKTDKDQEILSESG